MAAVQTPPELPARFRAENLERNLAALARVDRPLAERICLPVTSDHVVVGPDERMLLRVHGTSYPLELGPAAVEHCLADAERHSGALSGARSVLVFGTGLGELVVRLLDNRSSVRVRAWERDPWMLRLALMRRDWSRWIETRRLELALGTDLLPAHGGPCDPSQPVVWHPLLGRHYRHERRAFEEGLGSRRALLCTGGLLVDDLAAALRRRGFGLWPVDARGLALEELDVTAARVQPDLVASINMIDGLDGFCRDRNARLLCWEIDPAAGEPAPATGPTDHCHLFTWRASMVPAWQRAGFGNVAYLPLATDPETRKPEPLVARDRERYGAPISFVGSSMVANADAFRKRFVAYWTAWRRNAEKASEEAELLLDGLLAEQRRDFTTWRLPELLGGLAPEFLQAVAGTTATHDPIALVGEIAAAEKRLTTVARLGDLGIRVWGDTGWKVLEEGGVTYMGAAAHGSELNKIYCASAINLDVGRIYQSDIVTMRVFDVLACGGFVLPEHSEALAESFELGVELDSWSDPRELRRKVEHYLAHPDEARAMAERGRHAVIARHTVDFRVGTMLASMGLGATPDAVRVSEDP